MEILREPNPNLGVQYLTHCQTYGWLPWSCDGETNGTSGESKRLEGIQIVLVPKGGDAPADNYGGIPTNDARAYIEKK